MNASITGLRTELGTVLAQRMTRSADQPIQFNLASQGANSLLHDGHAWKDFPRRALADTRRALRSAQTGKASMLVHASFAFVHAVERGAPLQEPLRSSLEAILECEALVLAGAVPACVVRLGYLYGPQCADLRAYQSAFLLGRPYWCGPPAARQYHLHQFDAAAALLDAAKPKNAGKLLYATDALPASFRHLMDAFAHRVGRPKPRHLPLWSKRLARMIIREEHMQQVALPMPVDAPCPQVPGWKPQFANYRDGLDQVMAAWDQ